MNSKSPTGMILIVSLETACVSVSLSSTVLTAKRDFGWELHHKSSMLRIWLSLKVAGDGVVMQG